MWYAIYHQKTRKDLSEEKLPPGLQERIKVTWLLEQRQQVQKRYTNQMFHAVHVSTYNFFHSSQRYIASYLQRQG